MWIGTVCLPVAFLNWVSVELFCRIGNTFLVSNSNSFSQIKFLWYPLWPDFSWMIRVWIHGVHFSLYKFIWRFIDMCIGNKMAVFYYLRYTYILFHKNNITEMLALNYVCGVLRIMVTRHFWLCVWGKAYEESYGRVFRWAMEIQRGLRAVDELGILEFLNLLVILRYGLWRYKGNWFELRWVWMNFSAECWCEYFWAVVRCKRVELGVWCIIQIGDTALLVVSAYYFLESFMCEWCAFFAVQVHLMIYRNVY